MDKSPQAAAV